MLNSKWTLLSTLLSSTLSLSAADVVALFDGSTENPLLKSNYVLGWVRSSALIDGELYFGYGQPATGVYEWNNGDVQAYTLGGVFSSFSESNGSIYAAVNYNSGTHQITRTDENGTEVILDNAASLAKSTGLASTFFPQAANGKVVFNIQQGPTSGVDYGAIIYYDGTNFTYVAETGQSIPGMNGNFGVLTGFGNTISDDGSNVAFYYEDAQYNKHLFKWDGSTLSLAIQGGAQHSNGSTYYPKQVLYVGNTLYFTANEQDGDSGLYRIESNGDITQVINGNTPINGSSYYFDQQVMAKNGKIGFIAKASNPEVFNTYIFAGYTLSPGGTPQLLWESNDFDFTAEALSSLTLHGFDGNDMNLLIYTKTFAGFFATSANLSGETSFWASYEVTGSGDVNTGSWIGWIHLYPNSDWVYIYSIDSFAYLPESRAADPRGAWTFIRK